MTPKILLIASACIPASGGMVQAQTAAVAHADPRGRTDVPRTAAQPADAAAPDADTPASVQDIIITARRRNELLQDVPIAVSAITEAAIAQTGISGIEAIAIATPSLNFTRQISQGGLPFLRGVGSTQAAAGGESPVAVYVDDVYIGSPNGNIFSFNNIASIQVLKGPQGTLFGRNATGGVIQVQTKSPTFDPEMEASFGYGNYRYVESSAYVTGAITDKLAMNIAASYRNQDKGFGRSLLTGIETQKSRDWAVRSKLLWRPADGTQFLLTGDYGRQVSDIGSNGGVYPGTVAAGGAVFVGPYLTVAPGDDYAKIRYGGVGLRIDQELPFADLVSISAYRKTRLEFTLDQDSGPVPLAQVGPVRSPYKSLSQELQLVSKSDSALKWILGAFYLRSRTGYDPSRFGGLFVAPLLSTALNDRQTLDSYAAFGEATAQVLPDTNLTLGLRYTSDHYRLDVLGRTGFTAAGSFPLPGTTFGEKSTFSKLTYRAILDHHFSSDIMTYASYSRGFRSGGYNLAFPGTAAAPAGPVEPEILDAFEIGVKSKLFNGGLTLNGAAFYYDYTNVAVAFVLPGGSRTLNAAGSHIKGIDLDFIATPFRGLSIKGGLGILDGEYSSFPNGPILVANPGTCTPTPRTTGAPTGGNLACTGDLTGNRSVQAPRLTLTLGPSYVVETGGGSITLAANYYRNSGYFWDVQNSLKQPSYETVNGSVTWTSPDDHVSVRLWSNNVFDERYPSYVAADAVATRINFAAPRTYGVTGTVRF